MASQKDMRREDLVVPYVEPTKKGSGGDVSSEARCGPCIDIRSDAWCVPHRYDGYDIAHGSSMFPVAAARRRNRANSIDVSQMFTRNKMIAWTAVLFALQTWLAETSERKKTEGSGGLFAIAMANPFAEADEDTGETKQSQNYIHIRIQQRNGRKTLTTVQGLPKKFDQKKILKVIKKKFACNGTIVNDSEMGEVIQLQGDQRKDVQEFLVDKKEGLELDAKTIKASAFASSKPNERLLTRSQVHGF
ncbi:MAG: Eukaryotic translation initiation factor eIF-1 [Piccolia ochrophora]|nr:MAG: Eukaryotic translation initiation factor eIF-1 [Piccolia ochrophora]